MGLNYIPKGCMKEHNSGPLLFKLIFMYNQTGTQFALGLAVGYLKKAIYIIRTVQNETNLSSTSDSI